MAAMIAPRSHSAAAAPRLRRLLLRSRRWQGRGADAMRLDRHQIVRLDPVAWPAPGRGAPGRKGDAGRVGMARPRASADRAAAGVWRQRGHGPAGPSAAAVDLQAAL